MPLLPQAGPCPLATRGQGIGIPVSVLSTAPEPGPEAAGAQGQHVSRDPAWGQGGGPARTGLCVWDERSRVSRQPVLTCGIRGAQGGRCLSTPRPAPGPAGVQGLVGACGGMAVAL